jgi:hypothetical protein
LDLWGTPQRKQKLQKEFHDMTTPVKQQIFDQAAQLYNHLVQEKKDFERLNPAEQIEAEFQFLQESCLLKHLQEKVQATYLNKRNAIPGMNEKELDKISKKLDDSAEILKSVRANKEIALKYFEINSAMIKLQASPTFPEATAIQSLQERIKNLISESDNAYIINKENREALDVLKKTLQTLLFQQRIPYQGPILIAKDSLNLQPEPFSEPKAAIKEIPLKEKSPAESTPIQEKTKATATAIQSNISTLEELLTVHFLLESNATDSQLQEACQFLQLIDSKGVKNIFKMSDDHLRPIADRPFFHLCCIHKNEAPKKPNLSDLHYGNKAFAGVDSDSATNEERLRSVKRTIVELALQILEDTIDRNDDVTVSSLLKILEEIKLHPKDCVDKQNNVAYYLFYTFCYLHAIARTNNSSLIDPDQFGGDFGRIAFSISIDGVDPAIKYDAITQVRNDLKAAWKMK